MRNKINIFYVLIVCFTFLVSCDDDDKNEFSPDIKLMEKIWKKTKVTYDGKKMDRSKKTGPESLPNSEYFVVLPDNDYRTQDDDPKVNSDANQVGRWWMYKDALTVSFFHYPQQGLHEADVYEVTELTDTKLVMKKIILFLEQVSPNDTLYNGAPKLTETYEPIEIEFTSVGTTDNL